MATDKYEWVSLIADILKNSGHCHFLYGENYYVIIDEGYIMVI